MKLYIEKKLFTLVDKFSVKDEVGNEKYFVEGELLSLGHRLHIKNSSGVEIALVSEKLLTLLPKFFISSNGTQIAEITSKLSLTPKYEIKGLNWSVSGDFLGHDYIITKDNVSIVQIHKKWMSWGDCFEIDLIKETDEITTLAVVLAIDCILNVGRRINND
jgi:uncharacterized protein YxjI